MIDMAGLAQKGGAVYNHVRLANVRRTSTRSASRRARPPHPLGRDLVVTGTKVLASVKEGQSALVVNTAEVMPGDFTRNADFSLPAERIKRAIGAAAGPNGATSSTPRRSRRRCSAMPSPPTCSCWAMPIGPVGCPCPPPPSRRRSSSTARP